MLDEERIKIESIFETLRFILRETKELREGISHIKKQNRNMSDLLDQIKSADESLHAEVTAIGDRITAKLADLQSKLDALQATVDAGLQPSAADVQEATDIVTSLNNDAATLKSEAN